MFELSPERLEDADAVEALLDAAFGPGRFLKTSYRYRDGIPPVDGLSFVVRPEGADEAPIGTLRYWPIRVGEAELPALLLGPLGIAPAWQGRGVGRALMSGTLDRAAALGHRLVLLVGDLPYYQRFGFAPARPHGIVMPDENPDRLLARELAPGALAEAAGPVRRWAETASGAARHPDPARLLRQGRKPDPRTMQGAAAAKPSEV